MGTGFFYQFRKRGSKFVPALITNRHVIEGAKSADLHFHEADGEGNYKPLHQYKMHIDNFESLWTLHPDPNVDLAILPIGDILEQMRKERHNVFAFSISKDFLPTEEELREFVALEEIVMVGYPIGIWDSVNNLPILRKGVTATHPRFDYEGRPEFLIDAACFPGSSGSPVFLYNFGSFAHRDGDFVMGSRMKLLGVLYAGPIHSVEGQVEVETIPTTERYIARSGIPINLGFVIKSHLLNEFETIVGKSFASDDV